MDYKVKVSHSYHIGLKHNKNPSVYFYQSLQIMVFGIWLVSCRQCFNYLYQPAVKHIVYA
ncbi:hypothetical protein AO376_1353 [Moraxella catarrhalis]|nr:hypothetical protein AO376_1353 [Moraxella catarrhalis]OAV21723.1 hypothetical protein AO374_0056 [Moraxella catarrhalis]